MAALQVRKEFTDRATYWHCAEDRIIQDPTIKTPIGLIVHTLSEVNDKLAQGQYFFLDIIREGIALYEMNGHRFSEPKPQTAADAHAAAKEYLKIGMMLTAPSSGATVTHSKTVTLKRQSLTFIKLSSVFTAATC